MPIRTTRGSAGNVRAHRKTGKKKQRERKKERKPRYSRQCLIFRLFTLMLYKIFAHIAAMYWFLGKKQEPEVKKFFSLTFFCPVMGREALDFRANPMNIAKRSDKIFFYLVS